MLQKKFSKDPKVELISIEQFFEQSNYLTDINEDNLWNENEFHLGIYYKITSRFLIKVTYGFDLGFNVILEKIQVAYREGKTEYDLLDSKLNQIAINKEKSTEVNNEIQRIYESKELLDKTKYTPYILKEPKFFENYIIDVDYKTSIDSLFGKYVVVDVETNGLRKSNDDLLSISIYDPSIGKCYNRLLPLDLQPMVLTGWINGIKDEDLEGLRHITQEEIDKIIDFFDLNNKILLSYSGGKGTFDSSFIINYCKRHNLVGFENLHYENIKSNLPSALRDFEGYLTKDNMCKLFKIDGVQKKHTSFNDCLLEWKLFEKIDNQPLFFIDHDLFKYHKEYIVPVSYLNKYPQLIKYANISVPNIVGKSTVMFEYMLPNKALNQVKKFPTNITGIALENAISAALNAEEQDNYPFLSKNKKFLEHIGFLDCQIKQIPVEICDDGTLSSLDSENEEYIEDVNKVSKVIIDSLSPVFDFIKQNIFRSGKILNQEMAISEDGKVLALCDLSNEECVLEIKTYAISSDNEQIKTSLARQLHYESKGRRTFVLSIDFEKGIRGGIKAVIIRIYGIELKETAHEPIEGVRILHKDEIAVLNLILKNSDILNVQISRKLKMTQNKVSIIIKRLKELKYIVKEDEKNKRSRWILLRSTEDDKTKYLEIDGKEKYIFEKK